MPEGPWGDSSALYLLVKGVASGVLLLIVIAGFSGLGESAFLSWGGALIGVGLTVLSAMTLAGSWRLPRRVLFLLGYADLESWQVRGAWILAAQALVGLLWAFAALVGWAWLLALLTIPVACVALLTACYSTFLCCPSGAEGEGALVRQDRSVGALLLVSHGFVAGAAFLLLTGLAFGSLPVQTERGFLRFALWGGLLGHLFSVVLAMRRGMVVPHRRLSLVRKIRTAGAESRRFWGLVVVGALVAIACLAAAGTGEDGTSTVFAAILALLSAWAWSALWVRTAPASPGSVM
ncbi:MAG: hypothetical protein HY608_10665 [Planctomycetes bacterium]|nr:hypothetical protein [Planctomycetota bacterium]